MVVWHKVTRLRRALSITRKPNWAWRPDYGLLQMPKAFPEIKRGWPQWNKPFDPKNNEAPPSFRVYKPPPKPKVLVERNSEYYSPDNFHELLGKFQFEVRGHFPNKGYLAEEEVFKAAFDLHLVGWLKIREYFMLGHVQGDTYALSYFRRWLEEKHISPAAGTIEWVRLFDTNTGLPPPLEYKILKCHKDRRKYKNRKVHLLKVMEKVLIRRFQRQALEQLRDKEEAENAAAEKYRLGA